MSDPTRDPIRPTDDDARALARHILHTSRHAALAVTDQGAPHVSRIGFVATDDSRYLTLISELAHHTRLLRRDGRVALLVGEPAAKGDPLTSPRITLLGCARFLDPSEEEGAAARDAYLSAYPKARLYAGFADFSMVAFEIDAAHLNGGFGKAYHLTPADLKPAGA